MENFGVIFGIVLCICMVYAQNGEEHTDLKVSDPVMVKPGSEVTLSCIGSFTDAIYYIRNRINLEVKFFNGTIRKLTNGFYVHEDSKTLFGGSHAKYNFSFEGSSSGQNFAIVIKDIQFSDDGVYSCVLLNENNDQVKNVSTSITVVSPVRQLMMELHDASGVIASTESFTEGSKAVAVAPGQYKVTCKSKGSNPEPKMNLFYNQDSIYTSQMDKKDISGEGPTYTSTFTMDLIELKSMNDEQLLMCESNIAGGFYQAKRAGIKLLVKIDKPEFKCANLSTAAGERYRKIECDLVPKAGGEVPMCQNVMWKFGLTGQMHEMTFDEKYTDPNKEYNIMESECKAISNGLQVTLTLYTVEPKHMQTTFYIVYGVGSDAEQYAINIDLKETSGASLLTPLSLFMSMLLALMSRQLGRNL